MYVSGIYSVQPTYDATYVITSLKGVQDFLSRPGRLTHLELNTSHAFHEMASACKKNESLINQHKLMLINTKASFV